MDSLNREIFESQINQLISLNTNNFKGMVYRKTDTFVKRTDFTKDFLDNLPSNIKLEDDKLVKDLNAS